MRLLYLWNRVSAIADEWLEGTLKVRHLNWYYARFKYSHLLIYIIPFTMFEIGIFLNLLRRIRSQPFVYSENAAEFAGMVSGASATYFTYVHYGQRDEVLALIRQLSDFRTFEKPRTFDSTNKRMSFGGISFISLLYFIGIVSVIMLSATNCPEGSNDGCGLIMQVTYPNIDLTTPMARYIAMAIQIFGGFQMSINSILISWIYNALCEFLCSYIHHLTYMLSKIKKLKDPIARRRQFQDCARYYDHVIELSNSVKKLTSNIFIVYTVNSPIVMSMIAFQLMDRFSVIDASHLLGWFYGTGISCHFGQRLINTSESLIEAISISIPWDGDYQLGKDMKLMLLKSQRLMVIRGADVITVDHVLFVTIMKTAYSYMALFSD